MFPLECYTEVFEYINITCINVMYERFGNAFAGGNMIELTKLNGQKVLVNADLIELVEETPDTVVAFTTGRKIIVKEGRQEIRNLVKSYRKEICAP